VTPSLADSSSLLAASALSIISPTYSIINVPAGIYSFASRPYPPHQVLNLLIGG
jgi:hypothetical protein